MLSANLMWFCGLLNVLHHEYHDINCVVLSPTPSPVYDDICVTTFSHPVTYEIQMFVCFHPVFMRELKKI